MRKKIGLIIVLLMAFVWVPVSAKSMNGFYADNELELKKEIGTTTFVAGNLVDVSSEVDGALFVAGNNVTLSSHQDYLFAAGNNMVMKNMKVKDAFIAGSSVTIKESEIRDLYAAAGTIIVDSDITRNAYLSGDVITIRSTVHGDLKVACEELNIENGAVIEGKLIYPEEAKANILGSVEEKKTYKGSVEIETGKITVFDHFLTFVMGLCSMMIIGITLMLVSKKLFVKLEKDDKTVSNLATKFGIGFGVLFLVPIASIILLFTGVAAPLGIIAMLLWGILFYISAVPTSYFLGKWIFKDAIKNEFLLLIVSLAILYVINVIPILGGFTKFISLCVGLGFYFSYILDGIKTTEKK